MKIKALRPTLMENRDKFVEQLEHSQPNCTKYHLAFTMLTYISANFVGFSGDLNYVDDYADIMNGLEYRFGGFYER